MIITALIILAVVAVILIFFFLLGIISTGSFVYIWRAIYPWLVKMGRWAAQLKNLIFLFFVLLAIDIVVGFLATLLTGSIVLGIIAFFISLPIFLFFLLLAIVVWLVRLWRYGFPASRHGFWHFFFRVLGWLWVILDGILRFIGWILYHAPIRWIIAICLFYLRVVSFMVSWLLYHPPLRWLAIAGIFIMQLVARFVAMILYDPPIQWLKETKNFIVKLVGWIISIGMFCIRPIAAMTAWLLYHPPLRWLVNISFLFVRGLSWLVSWFLYHPPLRWLEQALLFVIEKVAFAASAVLYAPLPSLLKVGHRIKNTMYKIGSNLASLLNHRPVSWLVGVALWIMRLVAFVVSWILYSLLALVIKLYYHLKKTNNGGLAHNSKSHKKYNYADNTDCSAA